MKLKFIPQNIEVDIDSNKTVLEVSNELGLNIQSSCNGMCNCGDCRVFIKEGAENVLQPSNKELKLIGQGHYLDQRRLSCQLYCFGNVVIDLSEQEKRFHHGKFSSEFLKKTKKRSKEEAYSKGDILIKEDVDIKKTFSKKEP
ncbi:MAG: (2Fe-2S)-binding protein [Bdellovibrionales bacterium]|nr:(2Fe-2S)-binding protein [Bdellovibrionales bacterium]